MKKLFLTNSRKLINALQEAVKKHNRLKHNLDSQTLKKTFNDEMIIKCCGLN